MEMCVRLVQEGALTLVCALVMDKRCWHMAAELHALVNVILLLLPPSPSSAGREANFGILMMIRFYHCVVDWECVGSGWRERNDTCNKRRRFAKEDFLEEMII